MTRLSEQSEEGRIYCLVIEVGFDEQSRSYVSERLVIETDTRMLYFYESGTSSTHGIED
jgi:hypothetical protein